MTGTGGLLHPQHSQETDLLVGPLITEAQGQELFLGRSVVSAKIPDFSGVLSPKHQMLSIAQIQDYLRGGVDQMSQGNLSGATDWGI